MIPVLASPAASCALSRPPEVTQDTQRSAHAVDAILKILLVLRKNIVSFALSFVTVACDAASSPSAVCNLATSLLRCC